MGWWGWDNNSRGGLPCRGPRTRHFDKRTAAPWTCWEVYEMSTRPHSARDCCPTSCYLGWGSDGGESTAARGSRGSGVEWCHSFAIESGSTTLTLTTVIWARIPLHHFLIGLLSLVLLATDSSLAKNSLHGSQDFPSRSAALHQGSYLCQGSPCEGQSVLSCAWPRCWRQCQGNGLEAIKISSRTAGYARCRCPGSGG